MTLPQTITIWQTEHRGGDGQRIIGDTWSFAGCRNPSGVAFTPAVTEPYADGRYVFTWSANAYGDWVFDAQAQSDPTNPDYAYSAVITVTDSAVDAQPIADAVWAAPIAGAAAGTTGATLARTATLGSGVVTMPVTASTAVALIVERGDTYEGGEARTWTNADWAIDPADAIEMTATYAGTTTTYDGAVLNATTVAVELSGAETLALVPGRAHYRIKLRNVTQDLTLLSGLMTVLG